MNDNRMTAFVSLVAVFLCGFLSGCKEAKQVADLAKTMADPRAKGPMHERLKWKAEDFFTDAGVIKLCKAIEAKDLKEIERLVKSGVDVNAKGRANMTPLFWAFPMGEQVFKKMLELGADPNVKLTQNYLAFNGKSVTFAAVKLVDGPIYNQYFYDVPMDNYLSLVLKHGGDPNQEDLSGETPLFTAVFIPHDAKKIQLLLDAGARINHRDSQGFTAVYRAGAGAFSHSANSVLTLLAAGADYRIPNDNGFDLVLAIARDTMEREEHGDNDYGKWATANTRPLIDWLTKEGVNWDAARAALKDKDLMKNLKNTPADYKHRPWLPQREEKRGKGEEKGISPIISRS